MRISCSKKLLLFHIPRTGVSSVISALDNNLFVRAPPTPVNKLCSKFLPSLPRSIEKTYLRTHETAEHLRRLLRAPVFEDLTKIAFVRNPYSWLVSMYELVLQSPNHRHYRKIAAMRGFEDYVDWEIRRNRRTQHGYICDRNGQLIIDRLGRFEHLEADARRIFESLGVDIAPLPCINRLTRGDYREFYDTSSRRKVASHWRRDLEIFNYDFEGPTE